MLTKFNKILFVLIAMFGMVCLVGCGDVVEKDPNSGIIDSGNGGNGGNNQKPEETVYTVALTYLGDPYIPEEDFNYTYKEDIIVYWRNALEVKSSRVDPKTGIATITGLDGEYFVSVDYETLSPKMAYDPNIYSTNADEPFVEVELYEVFTPRSTNTVAGVGWWKITTPGAFRTKIEFDNYTGKPIPVHFEFAPEVSGFYRIETTVSIVNDNVNPVFQLYTGTMVAKWPSKSFNGDEPTESTGLGIYNPGIHGEYTYNMSFEFSCNSAETSSEFSQGNGCWNFTLTASSKTGTYPIILDWRIIRVDEKGDNIYVPHKTEYVRASELPDSAPEAYGTLYNSNNGTKNYYATGAKATGEEKRINEDRIMRKPDGTWWVCEKDDFGNYQPVSRLCWYVTSPHPYTDAGFSTYLENNFIMLDTATQSRKNFSTLVQDYAGVTNGDGVAYVTDEVVTFLQMYANKHYIFYDGKGGAGTADGAGVMATESYSWLFACCFYSYHKIPN